MGLGGLLAPGEPPARPARRRGRLGGRARRARSRWAPATAASPTTTSARATRSTSTPFRIARRPVTNAHLDALRRGRRLRAPRVVVRRELGLEGGVRHHARPCGGGGPPRSARLPRVLVRGRRLRHRARRPPPHRGRVGEGCDLGAGPAAGGGARVGVDRVAVRRVPGLPRPSVQGVLRGLLRRRAPRPARRLVGDPPARRDARPSATGTSRSAGRSSPACGWPATGRADGAARRRRGRRRLPARPGRRALARRRRARRPHAALQGAAAQALLRRARRRAVRPDLRAAGVLPDARRARDPASSTPTRSSSARRPPSSSSSARGPPPRRACCCARWPRPGTCAATSRSTSPRRWCARPPSELVEELPGLRVHGIVGDFERHLAHVPRRPGRPADRRLPRRHDRQLHAGQRAGASCARSRGCCAPAATTCCWAPTSSRTRP